MEHEIVTISRRLISAAITLYCCVEFNITFVGARALHIKGHVIVICFIRINFTLKNIGLGSWRTSALKSYAFTTIIDNMRRLNLVSSLVV